MTEKARCATCGVEFVGVHVCPITTDVIKFNAGTTGTVYTSTQYSGSVGKTFKCQHMQISGVIGATCGVCGELEADEYG